MAPSWAMQRSTYSPGVLKVARTFHLFPDGIGGVFQPIAHGEFAPSRLSCQALNCGGSNVTSPLPRYFTHTNRRPVAEAVRYRLDGDGWIARTRGLSSSVAVAVSNSGCPTLTCRLRSPATERTGAWFPARSGIVAADPPAPKFAAIIVGLRM